MGEAARKRKLQGSQAKRGSESNAKERGFDYSIPPHFAAIGSIDFNHKLREARVIGVSYGLEFSKELQRRVPCISLIGQNEMPLRDAFNEFEKWAEYGDADAVDVAIHFKKSGGYDLAISPEPRALIDRTLKFNAVATPMSFQVGWIKQIDTTSQPLVELRSHLERGIKPFLLSAGLYTGPASGLGASISQVKYLPELPQLLKFKISFGDEGSEGIGPIAQMAARASSPKDEKLSNDPRKAMPPKSHLLGLRQKRLKTLFPVTIWRFQDEKNRALVDELLALGLRIWQIQQAACNLLVSFELSKKPHFQQINGNQWPKVLLDHLHNRYEVADGNNSALQVLTKDNLLHQISLDSKMLYEAYENNELPSDIALSQKALQEALLLDPIPT